MRRSGHAAAATLAVGLMLLAPAGAGATAYSFTDLSSGLDPSNKIVTSAARSLGPRPLRGRPAQPERPSCHHWLRDR
jgi:hypothetical protein